MPGAKSACLRLWGEVKIEKPIRIVFDVHKDNITTQGNVLGIMILATIFINLTCES